VTPYSETIRAAPVSPLWQKSVDDASRIAFTDVLPDEKTVGAVRFLRAALACYASLGESAAS